MNVTYIYHSCFLVETDRFYYLFDHEKGRLPEIRSGPSACHKASNPQNADFGDWRLSIKATTDQFIRSCFFIQWLLKRLRAVSDGPFDQGFRMNRFRISATKVSASSIPKVAV